MTTTEKRAARSNRAAPLAERALAARLHLRPVPGLPEICLHLAHPGSRLGRMGGPPPYFAYPWAGGIALARYLLANPGLVAGRAVADIGAGSGLVSIAALQAGAAGATAHDCDTRALATVRLNARANGVTITTCLGDALSGPLPDAPVILIGDLFYDDALACGTLAFARACAGAGRLVLIGDPGRAPLPLAALRLLAEHEVPDMGDSPGKTRSAGVYTLRD